MGHGIRESLVLYPFHYGFLEEENLESLVFQTVGFRVVQDLREIAPFAVVHVIARRFLVELLLFRIRGVLLDVHPVIVLDIGAPFIERFAVHVVLLVGIPVLELPGVYHLVYQRILDDPVVKIHEFRIDVYLDGMVYRRMTPAI